jgi:hypothetical protein
MSSYSHHTCLQVNADHIVLSFAGGSSSASDGAVECKGDAGERHWFADRREFVAHNAFDNLRREAQEVMSCCESCQDRS